MSFVAKRTLPISVEKGEVDDMVGEIELREQAQEAAEKEPVQKAVQMEWALKVAEKESVQKAVQTEWVLKVAVRDLVKEEKPIGWDKKIYWPQPLPMW